ncbi:MULTISPECIES: mechanosensitive ion channel family protein [Proteiniphilum]|uniref:mechanosensitive ion channel family protein n=1 Tax=Proteiniphilum TaxID=294702 RepID=UPI001EEC1E7E|nr:MULTISPECIES: mechanosensitive ion channel domain-containing protein [Proteiniphilum]ULB34551.1 mechanosensitive ion channel [Proteiniphilum propionicum]
MTFIDHLLSPENPLRHPFIALLFLALFGILTAVYRQIIRRWRSRARKSRSRIDDFMVRLFTLPGIWFIFALLLNLFSGLLSEDKQVYGVLRKISQIMLILTVGWIVVQVVRALFHHWQKQLDIQNPDNLEARKRLTQMSMIERITVIAIIFIFTAIALMTIEQVRQLGMSLLASAGVAGIIIGFAAQRSFGQIFSGIQIAFTQPIRLDDVVVIEGEWGRIEEIHITYAVVKIWDERRLIVPIDYFLNNPIQNWTRSSSQILGTLFLPVSYDLPLEPLREELTRIVQGDPNWDGRVQNIQVTDSREWYKQLRVLVSSADSSRNWDLRVSVREKLIDFINTNYPGSFAKINTFGTALPNTNIRRKQGNQ